MAITRHLAKFVLMEHEFRPISGTVLLLGRQMVFLTPDEAQALVEASGIPIRSGAKIEYDRTAYGAAQKYISDTSFFSLFSDAVVLATDISAYEGADIIFDLSSRPPDHMIGGYDFIYNGSVFDNVFDPAACIRNASNMLKPRGVIMNYEGCAHSDPAYLKFTPDWFFDYYAVNGFSDFRAYVCVYENVHRSAWEVYEWAPFIETKPSPRVTWPMKIERDAMVVTLAEKSPEATSEENPVQGVYRSEHDVYIAAFEKYWDSKRQQAFNGFFRSQRPSTDRSTRPADPPPHRHSSLHELTNELISIGRNSPLKSLVPNSLKRAILRSSNKSKKTGPSCPSGNENPSAETAPPGYSYLGEIG